MNGENDDRANTEQKPLDLTKMSRSVADGVIRRRMSEERKNYPATSQPTFGNRPLSPKQTIFVVALIVVIWLIINFI